MSTLPEILDEVEMEYNRATQINEPFNSAHEGYAVILEELDELWDEIKKNIMNRDYEKIRKESIQVAAMAIRFINDICE